MERILSQTMRIKLSAQYCYTGSRYNVPIFQKTPAGKNIQEKDPGNYRHYAGSAGPGFDRRRGGDPGMVVKVPPKTYRTASKIIPGFGKQTRKEGIRSWLDRLKVTTTLMETGG